MGLTALHVAVRIHASVGQHNNTYLLRDRPKTMFGSIGSNQPPGHAGRNVLEMSLAHNGLLAERNIQLFSRAMIDLISDPHQEEGELFRRDKVVDFIPIKIHRENRPSKAASSTARPMDLVAPVNQRCAAGRLDSSQGEQNLMTANAKNQTKAKMSKGEAFASSIRPTIRNPRKPATPSTVTVRSAMAAFFIFALCPIPSSRAFPLRMIAWA
jgi:hypothetical protein